MNPPIFTLLALALLAAPLSGAAESAKAERLARTVFLDEIGVKNLRLETVAVEERDFEEVIFALGRVEVLPGRRAVVSSRVAGRVVKVNALPDHEVQAGDPVIILESRQPGDPPPEITLTAPLSGLVTEFAVAPGEPVHPDKALMAVVDLRTVYGIARVPEHLARHLARGLAATIRVPGWPEEVWDATLEHLGAVADPASGTLEAAFHVRNPGLRLRPGMRAEFSIAITNRAGVLAVPRAALQGDAASRVVYVASDSVPFAFERVPVVTGAMNDRYVEITQGLLPGDRVVTTGAYSLAFAGKGSVSLKEALDAAHGHEHNEDGSEVTKDQKAAGPAEDDGHDHGGSGGKLSGLTLFSLIGNGVLLVLLVVATLRRKPANEEAPAIPPTKPTSGGADHAE
ncbi:MAG: efflux RND transporter periplasmic adaptor subunit [Limisphaerales bacterium]